eukprot:SAG31_NODE_6291_length_2082_cov_1.197176_2_plen_24_part_01
MRTTTLARQRSAAAQDLQQNYQIC